MGKSAKYKHYNRSRFLPEYRSWSSMIERCTNPNHEYYNDYGNRNITICERWRNSFESFLEDMGPKPSFIHTLERIDNNGNYEPGNCKWGTKMEQSRNQRLRKDNKTGVRGLYWNKRLSKWGLEIRANGKRIHVGTYDTIEEAAKARELAEEKYWGKVYTNNETHRKLTA